MTGARAGCVGCLLPASPVRTSRGRPGRQSARRAHAVFSRRSATGSGTAAPGDPEPPASEAVAPLTRAVRELASGLLSAADSGRRAQHAANFLATSFEAILTEDANRAIEGWKRIAALSAEERQLMAQYLSAKDLGVLWRLAGELRDAPPSEQIAVLGTWGGVGDDLPWTEDDGIVLWECLAGSPTPLALMPARGRFQVAMFSSPQSGQSFGRIATRFGAVGDACLPAYFSVDLEPAANPVSGALAEARLDVEPVPGHGAMSAEDLPQMVRGRWPGPPSHPPPLFGGCAGFVRPLGPGVWIVQWWKNVPGELAWDHEGARGSPRVAMHALMVRGRVVGGSTGVGEGEAALEAVCSRTWVGELLGR
ncbi:unnamed protein product [Pedinophyceae sp. YPF-701]|nr:unnamed protein product [Pedinophyceae sp. YPF-701]